MTGIVGNAWEFDRFTPMGAIPSTVSLTTYSGESSVLALLTVGDGTLRRYGAVSYTKSGGL